MTLEESHFHAIKRWNIFFVDARYVWVEGLLNIEEYHFQAAKTQYRGSINARKVCVKCLMPRAESIFISKATEMTFSGHENVPKVSGPMSSGSHTSTEMAFSGHQNV